MKQKILLMASLLACANLFAVVSPATQGGTTQTIQATQADQTAQTAQAAQKPNVVIFGDSYSTFEGYIPEGYDCWYFKPGRNLNDVTAVEQTWWHLLADTLGYNILQNNSWSGATVSYSGYRGSDYAPRAFTTRMKLFPDLKPTPDLILILCATNDSWADSPLGEPKYADWLVDDLYQTLPAYCYMLDYLTRKFPDTQLLVIHNDGLKEELTKGVMQICEHYQVPFLQLEGIDKQRGHPSIKGMQQICRQVAAELARP